MLTVTTKGRPLFFQERIGYCGRRFRMIKFRTMRLDAEQVQHVVANEKDGPIFKNRRDPRITRIGPFLAQHEHRRDAAIVQRAGRQHVAGGPAPAGGQGSGAVSNPGSASGLAVQPGLTCLWQISGRSEIGFEQWVRMDLWYLRNQSLATDLKLLVRTPASVISGRGAY